MDNDAQAMHLLASNIRVAFISVGLYEYIITLPAEYRFYRAQILSKRLSRHCILFILIRYVSILVMVVNSVGFFGSFSPASCQRLYLMAPIFKVTQTACSQLILADRTYSISQKTPWVGLLLMSMLMASTVMELFTSVYKRQAVQAFENNCTSGNSTSNLIAWYFYVIAMIYDVTTIGISVAYLCRYIKETKTVSGFARRLLYEGIGYIALLSAANIANIILFHSHNLLIQSSAASVGYFLTWITCQRILIHQRDASDKYGSHASQSQLNTVSTRITSAFRLTQEVNRTSFSRSLPHRGRRFTVTSRVTRKQFSTQAEMDSKMDSKDITTVSAQDIPSDLEFNSVGDVYMAGIEEVDEVIWGEEKGPGLRPPAVYNHRMIP